jgi:hypothetical protein
VLRFLVPFERVLLPVFFKGDYCMKNEQHDHGDAGLAEIWRDANHRRTQDVRCLITKVLKTVAARIDPPS